MSVASNPASAARAGPDAPPVRSTARGWVASDRAVVAVLAAWMVVLAVLTWNRWGDLTMDTGYDLLAASRTAGGELPYVDYVYFYGPLSPFLLGGIYVVTGAALWPAIALGLVLSAVAVLLTYRLARRFAAPIPAGLAAMLTATAALSSANNSYVLPHSTSAPLAIVFVLAALLLLTGWTASPAGRRSLIGAGALCGLAAITRPELAVPLFAAVAAWLLLRVWWSRGQRRDSWLDMAAVLAPALVIPAVVYGVFLTAVSPHALVFENLYPRDFVRAAGHVVLHAHAPLTAASIVKLLGYVAIYAIGTIALLGLARLVGADPRRRTWAITIGLGVAAAFVLVLVVRPETVRYYLQFAYGWIPAAAWFAAGVVTWRARRPRGRRPAEQAALLVLLLLAAATTATYASFKPFPNALFPEATPYVLPLAAVALVWLHISELGAGRPVAAAMGSAWIALLVLASAGLMIHDARRETSVVRGTNGTLTARPAEGPALQQALDLIEQRTRPGDPILLAPQLSALYVIADRSDPLRQLSLLPGALPDAASEDQAITQMNDVQLAVTDRTPLRTYEHGAFGTTFDRRLAAWLRRDFRRLTTLRGTDPSPRLLDVWIRRTQ